MSGRTFAVLIVLVFVMGGLMGVSITAHLAAQERARLTEWGLQCQAGGGHLRQELDNIYCVSAGQP